MSKRSLCIKIKKIYGEKTLFQVKKLGIINRELKIQHNMDHIYIPLVRRPDVTEHMRLKAQLPYFELETKVFMKKKPQGKTLRQVLERQLPPNLLAVLPRALDMIGDIAVIEIPSALENHRQAIGNAILETHKNVRTVFAKIGAVTGTYRLRKVELITGEEKTITVHKENGCKYQVDVRNVYFSPRLSHEHNRVASTIQKNEAVLDLFAGVGSFSVLIAKENAGIKVYAIDINPAAIELLKKNIRLNRVDNQVTPILGDARKAVEENLLGVADRVIMNLPEKAIEFVDVACKAIKPSGGIVHYYAFIRFPKTLEGSQLLFSEAVEKAGRKITRFLTARTIRETAPHEYQIVIDAKIV